MFPVLLGKKKLLTGAVRWSRCRRAGLRVGVEVSERLRETRTLQARQQRGLTDAAVRVLVGELVSERAAARKAAGKVREEVSAKDHVDPRVAAAVEAGEEGGERHGGILGVCGGNENRALSGTL